jgi:hypothetical protein
MRNEGKPPRKVFAVCRVNHRFTKLINIMKIKEKTHEICLGGLYKGGLYFVEEVQTKLRYSHLTFVALCEVLDLEATAHVRRVLRVILQTPSPADVERRLTNQIADHFATRHHSVHQRYGK